MTPDTLAAIVARPIDELERLAAAATPGPWVRGVWSGQCHIEHKHGEDRCKYDPEFQAWPEDFHRLASQTAAVLDVISHDGEVTGNYDYEEGGIIHEADAAYIAAVSPDVVLALLADRRALLGLLLETRDALDGLLDDTQHSEHDCDDTDCPVVAAVAALARLAALDPEPPA